MTKRPSAAEGHEQHTSIAARVAPGTLAAEGVREHFQQQNLAGQLRDEWELSEETQEIGLRGVAAARIALSSARQQPPVQDVTVEPVQGTLPVDWRTESGRPF